MKDEDQPQQKRPPLQFGIRAVLAVTVGAALLFGLLRWLEVPPQASYVVLAVLVAAAIAAVGLLAAIAGSDADDDEPG